MLAYSTFLFPSRMKPFYKAHIIFFNLKRNNFFQQIKIAVGEEVVSRKQRVRSLRRREAETEAVATTEKILSQTER